MSEAARRREGPATFREVFGVGEFRVLWAAELQSVIGDMLARVAVSILVFHQTGSAALTALTYALMLLPEMLGGPLLAGLADRYPRRRVMVACDAARACLVGIMALPGTPLPALAVLVFVVSLLGPLFTAAQFATLPLVLEGDRYDVGQATRQITVQVAQMGGFAAGGALVALAGTRPALALNAATFVLSALLIRIGLRHRPAPQHPASAPDPASGDHASADVNGTVTHFGRLAVGLQTIWRSPALRTIVALAFLAAFVVVPEGLAAVYAAEIGATLSAVGVLLAAHPLGLVVGGILFGRFTPPAWRRRLMAPLAVAAMVPLIPFAAEPGVAVAALLLMVSGACGSYQITASTTFARLVPDDRRSQAGGLAASGLIAVQGLGVAGGGVLAQWLDSAADAIALAGAVGVVIGLLLAARWRAISTREPSPGLST